MLSHLEEIRLPALVREKFTKSEFNSEGFAEMLLHQFLYLTKRSKKCFRLNPFFSVHRFFFFTIGVTDYSDRMFFFFKYLFSVECIELESERASA